jgi:hypothetical protein
MNSNEVRSHAREIGLKPGKQTKVNLVRAIQRTEGNFDCFATAANGECDQMGCQWRQDCFSAAKRLHA